LGEFAWAHQQAAHYWTHSVTQVTTLNEAIQAFEAYYHWRELPDLHAAASVLLKSRHNQWQQFLPLASNLYRMGLVQPVVDAITRVLPDLEAAQPRPGQLSELYNLLGDACWIKGQVREAIHYQEKTIATTESLLAGLDAQASPREKPDRLQHYYLKMLNIDSRLSIGLYYIDLWELEAAQTCFEAVIRQAQQSDHAAWAEKAGIALALVYSLLGQPERAKALADRCYEGFLQAQSHEKTGRFAYFIQLLAQTYNNIGEGEKALGLYGVAIAFAESGHYLQVQARALTGLAELHRKRGDLATALALHRQSLTLLEQIGATCDLAEAYWQMALSAKLSEPERFGQYCEKTQALFAALDAPKQMQRLAKGRAS
jgi:tetratricopeptide (TPR) repeat protein